MVIELEAKEDQFELLIIAPKSWQVMISSSFNAVKGDTIRYSEVDSDMIPTGRVIVGVIRWVSSGDMTVNNNDVTIAYCYVIGESIGVATISGSLIIG